MTDHIQVFTTTDKKENAQKIAREAVKQKVAACVQIVGPILSTFQWKGNVEEEEEWLLIIKSRGELYEKLEKTIKGIHTYEVPEVIASPIIAGSRNYLNWLDNEVKG